MIMGLEIKKNHHQKTKHSKTQLAKTLITTIASKSQYIHRNYRTTD